MQYKTKVDGYNASIEKAQSELAKLGGLEAKASLSPQIARLSTATARLSSLSSQLSNSLKSPPDADQFVDTVDELEASYLRLKPTGKFPAFDRGVARRQISDLTKATSRKDVGSYPRPRKGQSGKELGLVIAAWLFALFVDLALYKRVKSDFRVGLAEIKERTNVEPDRSRSGLLASFKANAEKRKAEKSAAKARKKARREAEEEARHQERLAGINAVPIDELDISEDSDNGVWLDFDDEDGTPAPAALTPSEDEIPPGVFDWDNDDPVTLPDPAAAPATV